MPMTMSRAVAECLRHTARWLESEAALLQSGEVVRMRNGNDESKSHAEELIHRVRNMETSIAAFERRLDLEEASLNKVRELPSTAQLHSLGSFTVGVKTV